MKKKILFLLLGCAVICGAAEYFVSNNGNDRWEGSAKKPFRTIQQAAKVAKAGDVVTVRAGRYSELIVVQNSGTPEAPIVFRGAPGETVLLTGALPVEGKWKKVPGYRYIYETFSPWEVNMFFDSVLLNRYMRVDSFEMLDRQPGAFMLDKATGKLYVNTFSGAHPDALRYLIIPFYEGGSRYGINQDSKLIPFNGKTAGVYGYGKGVMIFGSNIIWENFHMAHFPGQAIRVNAPAKNVIIRNNTVFGGTCGIMFYGGVENSKIINNKVFRVAGTGIMLAGNGKKCLVKGNFVFNCGTCSPFKSARTGSEGNIFNIAHYGAFSNTDIIDNIAVSTDPERCGTNIMRNKGGIRKHTTQTGNVFYGGNVNLYAVDNGTALLANNTIYPGAYNIGTLRSGNKYLPVMKDNLCLNAKNDPKFADVTHFDFRLRSDSAYLGKGAFPKTAPIFYAAPQGKGSGRTPEAPCSAAVAMSKVKGGETIYLLPGEYSFKATVAGNVKLANYKEGKATIRKSVIIGRGKVTLDGVAFAGTSFRIKGEVAARRSIFDNCDVQGDKLKLENSTLREARIAGKTTLRNSLVLGSGNKFAYAGMISENNCFTSEKALAELRRNVEEAHKSFFRNVTLDKEFFLSPESDLACAGLDCSPIGARVAKRQAQPFIVEELRWKQVSSDGVMFSWYTPRHYCHVSVRSYSYADRKENDAISLRQGSLRETQEQTLLKNFKAGQKYKVSFYFYPIKGEPMVARTLDFTFPSSFEHKPVTLQVDKKAPGAFRSIARAMEKAGPGDTVVVGPGVYTESVPIYLSGITLKSRIPGKAVFNLAGLLNYSIMTVNTSNVTIEGFRFTGLPYSAGGKTINTSRVVNFTLRNCYFERRASGGTGNIHLFGYNPDGMLVENCVFDSGFHGVWIYPGKNIVVRNCTFWGGGVNAIHVGCEQGWKTEIYNNIFVDTVSNHHSPAVSVAEHGPHVYCDYNIYWKTQRAPMQRYYAFGRHSPTHEYSAVWHVKKKDLTLTLEETRKRYGVEKHGIEADPLFVDGEGRNFQLRKGSPAFGKGKDGKNIGADFSVFK